IVCVIKEFVAVDNWENRKTIIAKLFYKIQNVKDFQWRYKNT
ncbi:hypothetical protein DOY81_000657, partial [Sarcophaga bullata]